TLGYLGMVANSPGDAANNTAVLQGIIQLAQAYSDGECPGSPPDFGAIILFPGHSLVPAPINNESGFTDEGAKYYLEFPDETGVTAAISIACNWPILFLGT